MQHLAQRNVQAAQQLQQAGATLSNGGKTDSSGPHPTSPFDSLPPGGTSSASGAAAAVGASAPSASQVLVTRLLSDARAHSTAVQVSVGIRAHAAALSWAAQHLIRREEAGGHPCWPSSRAPDLMCVRSSPGVPSTPPTLPTCSAQRAAFVSLTGLNDLSYGGVFQRDADGTQHTQRTNETPSDTQHSGGLYGALLAQLQKGQPAADAQQGASGGGGRAAAPAGAAAAAGGSLGGEGGVATRPSVVSVALRTGSGSLAAGAAGGGAGGAGGPVGAGLVPPPGGAVRFGGSAHLPGYVPSLHGGPADGAAAAGGAKQSSSAHAAVPAEVTAVPDRGLVTGAKVRAGGTAPRVGRDVCRSLPAPFSKLTAVRVSVRRCLSASSPPTCRWPRSTLSWRPCARTGATPW